MSDLKSTQGPWMVNENGGCFEIIDVHGNAIGMAHEMHNAVLMASSTELLNAMIMIQEKVDQLAAAKEFFPAGIPVNYLDDELEEIREMLSAGFEKIYAESEA